MDVSWSNKIGAAEVLEEVAVMNPAGGAGGSE